MQYFRDSTTCQVFAFDADVEAKKNDSGVWEFFSGGEKLPAAYPAALEPTDEPTPPAYVPTLAEVQAQRDALLAEAALRIAPLQDAADLGIVTAAEAAALKAWKRYRVDLSRVDLGTAPVTWPSAPAA